MQAVGVGGGGVYSSTSPGLRPAAPSAPEEGPHLPRCPAVSDCRGPPGLGCIEGPKGICISSFRFEYHCFHA